MQKYLVEFLGTLLLTFTIFATGNWLAIGASLAVAVYFAKGSGGPGAFNPAVALAYLCAGKLSKRDILPYILMEIAGAMVAFWLFTHKYKWGY